MKFIFYYLSDLKLKTDAVNLPVKCLLRSQSEAAESPFPINFYKTGHFSADAAPLLKKKMQVSNLETTSIFYTFYA